MKCQEEIVMLVCVPSVNTNNGGRACVEICLFVHWKCSLFRFQNKKIAGAHQTHNIKLENLPLKNMKYVLVPYWLRC
jgi:hypothetical protein